MKNVDIKGASCVGCDKGGCAGGKGRETETEKTRFTGREVML